MRVALTSQKQGNILNEYIILHASSAGLWYLLVCTCFSFFISIELVTKRNRYICVTILLILQMMTDLESLVMSIFRLGLFLDEPLLSISSGREELQYIEITLFPTKSFPTKLFRFL